MASIDERHIRELAVEHGVPEAVADEMRGQLRPCVYLVRQEDLPGQETDARPAARTGGLPALPAGVVWPSGGEPLVLTIDCAELPRDVLDFPLPSAPWEPTAELTAAAVDIAALVPDEGRGPGAAFRRRVTVPDDTEQGDRLLALLGRDPSWISRAWKKLA